MDHYQRRALIFLGHSIETAGHIITTTASSNFPPHARVQHVRGALDGLLLSARAVSELVPDTRSAMASDAQAQPRTVIGTPPLIRARADRALCKVVVTGGGDEKKVVLFECTPGYAREKAAELLAAADAAEAS